MNKRIIAHLDMDAFFAAVEERDNPRIQGKPIVVGSDPMYGQGRGVVSTANYKAREYGIRSALPISKAWQLSQMAKAEGKPEAVFLDVNFRKYEKASAEIMQIVGKYSPLIEQASIDEAYFDLSHLKNFTKAKKICQEIKNEIKNKQKLTASVGLGPNKLIAKIASDMQKPNGLTLVLPEETEGFLEPLSVRKIPGIGPQTEKIFWKMGIKTVKELKTVSFNIMTNLLGKWGMDLYYKIRGRDESPLIHEREVKSVGEQETFEKDSLDFKIIFSHLNKLCEDVFGRFRENGFKKFKTIVITVRFSDFETKTKSHTLIKSAKDIKALKNEVLKLILPFLDRRQNPKQKLIRLIGVRVEKLG